MAEQQALGPIQDLNSKEIEDYLRTSYTPGLQGFEDIAQNYLLRTSAKTLRTISRMFEQRSNQSKVQGANSALIKPTQYLTSLLKHHDFNVSAAARTAGIHRQSLHRLMRKHEIRTADRFSDPAPAVHGLV